MPIKRPINAAEAATIPKIQVIDVSITFRPISIINITYRDRMISVAIAM